MPNVLFQELGFPIMLVDPPMVQVRGETLPDINMADLQAAVFGLLVAKPSRLTGDEVKFIRKFLRLRQADLAEVLNMANHSVVSQWESRQADSAGMDYNTEVLLRIWMASKQGHSAQVIDLLEHRLKRLRAASAEPMAVSLPAAA